VGKVGGEDGWKHFDHCLLLGGKFISWMFGCCGTDPGV
jgi:hypothetical protein